MTKQRTNLTGFIINNLGIRLPVVCCKIHDFFLETEFNDRKYWRCSVCKQLEITDDNVKEISNFNVNSKLENNKENRKCLKNM